ncbi:hypothetical protein LXL04_037011 [Taraxacum kok-saghyz]
MSSTSTAVDSHSPPVDGLHSPESILDNKDDEKVEESVEHDNKNAQEGFGNEKAVHGGAADAPAGVQLNEAVQISPDQSQSGVDENRCEIIYSFPPDLSILNINGRMRYELVTVRENGRLQIFMVPYRCPQLVRSPLRNGRLRMWLVNDDEYGGEQVSPPQGRRLDDSVVD